MSPLLLVLVGMAVVLGGVLALRLHAFLALIIAAMIVAALTPGQAVRHFLGEQVAVGRVVEPVAAGHDDVLLRFQGSTATDVGMRFHILHFASASGRFHDVAEVTITSDPPGDRAFARFIRRDREVTWPATGRKDVEREPVEIGRGDLVIAPTQLAAALNPKIPHIAERVAEGFGKTCVDIGILIALAAIVGQCLLASGAAERIVRSTLRVVGEKRAPAAFLGSGFLLGIPVFFDTVFYLLIPLGKAMRLRTGRNYLLYILAIVAGATMTHSLVPPTPGPLYAASAFGVDVGTMILGGLAVSVVTAVVGFAYAVWADRQWDIPLRETAEGSIGELATNKEADDAALPPLGLALLPIVLPVVLIAGNAVIETWTKSLKPGDALPQWVKTIAPIAAMIGNKNFALLLAALIAMATQALWRRAGGKAGVGEAVNTALTSGGMVILITAAGGAFGLVLRQTGIAGEIQHLAGGWHVAVLPLAFLVTALVRTAQGSATVAMITAAGIFAPLAAAGSLAFHPLYLALAVGCGSKPIMWMNDSGFWVITKMTGLRESETLKSATVMMLLMGLAGLAAVMLAAAVMPMK